MNFTIGLAAGHTGNTDDLDRKAEHMACLGALDFAQRLLIGSGIKVVTPPRELYRLVNNTSLERRIQFFNQQPLDAAVEIHLNRGGPKASYSLALYWQKRIGPRNFQTSRKGKPLAQEIAASLKANLPWRSMGARGMDWAGPGGLYFLNKSKAPAVIIEAGFMDSADGAWKWLDSPAGSVQHGMAIAQGIINYARRASR